MSDRLSPQRGGRKPSLRESLPELLYKLRTEHSTPGKQAAAVAAGVFVGCTPLYGLHFPMCILASRLFRLNLLLTYLAAYVNNPLTAVFLTFGQIQLGHRLLEGAWLPLTIAGLRSVQLSEYVVDLAVGGAVSSLAIAAVSGLLVWIWLRRTQISREVGGLVERTAKRYIPAGIAHWEFVRAKLRFDPMYQALLRLGVVPSGGTVVDLGCGRGIVLALLATAPALFDEQIWPDGWPDPPRDLALVGIERAPRAARAARRALGSEASILEHDLCTLSIPGARTILLVDVLHYLPVEAQSALVERAVQALEPNGVLVVREPDAACGWRFQLTHCAERLRALMRGHLRQRFAYRSAAAWIDLLRAHGLEVESRPMNDGTPFGNTLLVGRVKSEGR
jgi:uncharacterized protein (DUF2062 family)/trans-aconitate methyltransferase